MAASNDERLRLIEALKFASVAIEKDDNSGLSQYVAIRDHWLMAENNTFCIGMPFSSGLEMCLHAEKLHAALAQCGQHFQMTQLSAQELSIKSDKFRAVIPVLPSDTIAPLNPDLKCGALSPAILKGFAAVQKLCTGKDARIIGQSVLLRSNVVIATNGGILVEYWHGIHLPMAIPKKTVDTIVKLDKPLTGFGFNPGVSFTFYFADNSFLKTRLIAGEWPNIDKLFANKFNPGSAKPLWNGFADAIAALDKFIELDTVYFHDGVLSTHRNLEHAAASYTVTGLPAGYAFAPSYWRTVLPLCENVSIAAPGEPFGFMSSSARGLILGKT
jgi:hypothetical protein